MMQSRISTRKRNPRGGGWRAPAAAVLVAAALSLLAAPPSPLVAAAAAELIDLGSPIPVEVHFLFDPLTLVRIPPGAFGSYPEGTLAEIQVDMPSCNGPNCISGQGLLVAFDGRYSGDLVSPVTMQIRYDEEAVRLFGVTEEDLVIARWDERFRDWRPYAGQEIDPERNLISAPETENIRAFVAVFAGNPAPVAPRSWGAIKALYAVEP